MNFELKNLFRGLTQNRGLKKIDVIMKNEAVIVLFSEITDDTVGTEDKMTICFIKKFSSLLALVSAIRENKFERNLQAECEIVKYFFAFNQINYRRYASYQQIYLRELQSININAMVNLAQCGFGDSLSGYLFSCVHVIITSILNKQRKRQECPHCARFSTDIAKINTWLLRLISMQKLGKIFQKNTMKYKHGS